FSLQITPPCNNERYYEYMGRCCTKCDPGRALIEVHPGNSTFHRLCACIAGYHWNEDCDCCRRNTKCPLGSGVMYPIQEDKDAVCLPCPTGYFSNVSSSTDECKSWTNCTALGAEEKKDHDYNYPNVPPQAPPRSLGPLQWDWHNPRWTLKTNQLFYMLVAPLLLVALVGIVVLAVYYRNKGKVLTADLQYWVSEICTQIKGAKDPPTDTFLNTNVTSLSGLPLLQGTYLLHHDEYSFSDDLCFPAGHVMFESEAENGHLRQVPTEDEYLDRIPQGQTYFKPLRSQPDSTPPLLFSEPLEVEENVSLSQCFVGTESLVELSDCCCSDVSCGADLSRASSDKGPLPSCYRCSCDDTGHIESRDTGGSLPAPTVTNSCPACGISSRESPRKPGNTADSLKQSGPSPQCTCGLDSSSGNQSAPTSGPSAAGEPSDGTQAKHQNAKRDNAGSNGSAPDPPVASGNVTGNGNSTFISSGQVMNFKGDIIVVYVSQNSQEGSASPGATEGNLGSPVQEENNRCETFAGNVHQYKEKCAEMDSYHSTESEGGAGGVGDYKRTSGPVVQEETQDCPNRKHLGNEASQPVQEEGRPEQFLEKVWH
ncbi:PREDICTED: tumor necrosis factor receptor superfamily member 11A-like, partial [Gekko japonicus]|uniref:Tumor necrosis factor receptor superfamily member 11A-like n=1 Tax=Gekko japonicus TaxID=146911 RepID=A0ABM1LD19_GEKJA